MSLEMSCARSTSAAAKLKKQQAEVAGKSATLEALAASLAGRQAELDGLGKELTRERSLLEQMAAQLEVRAFGGAAWLTLRGRRRPRQCAWGWPEPLVGSPSWLCGGASDACSNNPHPHARHTPLHTPCRRSVRCWRALRVA
jgi:hypothetical protein